jgi:hypothetical protein
MKATLSELEGRKAWLVDPEDRRSCEVEHSRSRCRIEHLLATPRSTESRIARDRGCDSTRFIVCECQSRTSHGERRPGVHQLMSLKTPYRYLDRTDLSERPLTRVRGKLTRSDGADTCIGADVGKEFVVATQSDSAGGWHFMMDTSLRLSGSGRSGERAYELFKLRPMTPTYAYFEPGRKSPEATSMLAPSWQV